MGRVVIPGFRKIETSGGGEGGTSNYNDLTNKPFINNVPLVGNLNTVDLKLTDKTLTEEGVPAEAKTVGDKLEEHSTSLTALSEQLGNHTVKSDVPENAVFTDTVYDDSVVKDEIDKINSNLDTLEFGEVAGGENFIDNGKLLQGTINTEGNMVILSTRVCTNFIPIESGKQYSISVNESIRNYAFYDVNKGFISITSDSATMKEATFTAPSNAKYIRISTCKYNATNTNILPSEIRIMLAEGSVALPYEPYIPSVKMLAEEKADKSETTVNLLNPTLKTTTINGVTCTNNGDGTYTLNGTCDADGEFTLYRGLSTSSIVRLVGCPSDGGDTKYYLRITGNGNDYGNGYITQSAVTNVNITLAIKLGTTFNNLTFKPMLTTNLNATYDDFVPYTGDDDSLNKDVAKLKNDLDKLSSLPIGSIIQIDAAKDDIETTTQKYGWQYLGKSNIEYDRGSATLLVTNVYRKNE